METSKLCQRCKELMTAAWIEVGCERENTLFKVMAVENRHPSEYTRAETDFRARWPTNRILEVLYLEQKTRQNIQLWIHKSVQEVRRCAARAECHICYLGTADEEFTHRGVDMWPHEEAYILIGFCGVRDRKEKDRHRLSFYYLGQNMWSQSTFVGISLDPARPDGRIPDLSFEDNHRIAGISGRTLNRVQAWLQDCKANHSTCAAAGSYGRGRLPTRLIQIRGSIGQPCVKLVETKDIDVTVPPPYACLSHCWGLSGPEVRLLSDNHTKWLRRIPFEHLTKTFREAILVSQALGVEYLWIDALCIIQNNHQDWALEATTMCDVYSESLVTLAATASIDGHAGLIVQNFPSRCNLSFDVNGLYGPKGLWCVTQCPCCAEQRLNDAHLNQRCWVLQVDIWWHCQKTLDAEVPLTDDSWVNSPHISSFGDETASHFEKGEWPELVEAYSRLKLTYPKDKLAAMSGIAAAFSARHHLPQTDYYAGIWRRSFPSDLLWETLDQDEQGNQVPRRDTGAAPSWSWASQASGVMFYASITDLEWHPKFDVVDVRVNPDPANSHVGSPFDPVQRGVIRLNTILIDAIEDKGSSFILRDKYDMLHELKHTSEGRKHGFNNSGSTAQDWSKSTYALPVANYIAESFGGDRVRTQLFFFFIIAPSPTRPNCFVKLDCVRGSPMSGAVGDPRSWWLEGREIEASLHRRAHGNGVYEIEII